MGVKGSPKEVAAEIAKDEPARWKRAQTVLFAPNMVCPKLPPLCAEAHSLQTDEIITGVTFPAWSANRRWAFEEFATHRGAFALAGIAAHMDLTGSTARNVRLGAFGAASVPMRLTAAEVDPSDDIHAGADYRRALVTTLLERALSRIAG